MLLAAGEGSRFGGPKALIELEGQTLAARGAATLVAGGAEPVIVVTGAAGVRLPGVTMADNPDWRSGMASSLRVGLAAVPAVPGAAIIALADQPLVSPGTISRLIAGYLAGAEVAVACYGGKSRNPVLIARRHWAAALASASGDQGARSFLRARPDLVTLIECGDIGRPDDLDTPEDLAWITRLLGSGDHLGASAPVRTASATSTPNR